MTHIKLLSGASVTVYESREFYGASAGQQCVSLAVLDYYDGLAVACTPEQALDLAGALIAQAHLIRTRAERAREAASDVAPATRDLQSHSAVNPAPAGALDQAPAPATRGTL